MALHSHCRALLGSALVLSGATASGCLGVDKLDLKPAEVTFIALDEKETLKATPINDKGRGLKIPVTEMSWSSSDAKVVEVSKEGVLTTKGYGSAEVSVSVGGKTASSKIRVAKPTQVKITPENPEVVAAGPPMKLAAQIFDEKGVQIPTKIVVWSSLDKGIARVDSGEVQGVNVGSGKIQAKCGEAVGETTVTVKYPKIGRLAFKSEHEDLEVGDEVAMPVYAFSAENKPLLVVSFTYKSSKPKIASVNEAGLVKALKPGSATIIVSGDGQTAKATVKVRR